MSNQSFPKKPQTPPPAGGNKAQGVGKLDPQKTGLPQDPASAKEEAIKRLLAEMADSDPAKLAEIIHQWLSEDKK